MSEGRQTASLNIGKLTPRSAKYPQDKGFRADIRDQMKELSTILNSVFNQIEDASPALMLNALHSTFLKSQTYCPIATGAMKESGYLETVSQARGNVKVEMGYGKGGQPSYTMFVHENINAYHKPPTRAKWLQAAVYEDLSGLLGKLQAEYKMLLGGLG